MGRKTFLRAGRVAVGVAALLLIGSPSVVAAESVTPPAVAPWVPGQGRVWELVTSAQVAPTLYNTRAISVDGDRVAYMTMGPLPGATNGAPFPSAAVAVRGPDGWENSPVATPYPEQGTLPGYVGFVYFGAQLFDPDLSTWFGLRNLATSLGPGETTDMHLFRWSADGAYTDLADLGPGGQVVGASVDGRRLFVSSGNHLLPADAARTEGRSVYEIAGSSLHLVDVDNSGALLSSCGSSVPGDFDRGGEPIYFPAAVSSDGRRVFFSSRPGCAGPARVFLRENGELTTEISGSQCTLPDCGPEEDVTFVGATPDGARAFLVTAQRLTDDDNDSASDLYRYDVSDQSLTLLSAVSGGPEIAATTTPVHPSTDGSRVYFVAREWDGPNAVGLEDLYVVDSRGTDLVPGLNGAQGGVAGKHEGYLETSADGRYAVYATKEPLSGSDSDSNWDIYRYDAADRSQTLISIGGDASSEASFTTSYFTETVPSHPYRAVSRAGDRIFFRSTGRLLPEDRNEVADVYEWANGSLGLVSSGTGVSSSDFVGSTGDGSTAFFETPQTLVPADRDGGQVDIYAARIGGGFPQPPGPPAECGRSCNRHGGRADATVPADNGGRIEIRHPDAADRRRIAASGWISLLAEVPVAGRLVARARADIGGRSRTVAAKALAVEAPGQTRLRMRLSRPARRLLARGRSLEVELSLHLFGSTTGENLRFTLKGKR